MPGVSRLRILSLTGFLTVFFLAPVLSRVSTGLGFCPELLLVARRLPRRTSRGAGAGCWPLKRGVRGQELPRPAWTQLAPRLPYM